MAYDFNVGSWSLHTCRPTITPMPKEQQTPEQTIKDMLENEKQVFGGECLFDDFVLERGFSLGIDKAISLIPDIVKVVEENQIVKGDIIGKKLYITTKQKVNSVILSSETELLEYKAALKEPKE
jgi:hypothetical protein